MGIISLSLPGAAPSPISLARGHVIRGVGDRPQGDRVSLQSLELEVAPGGRHCPLTDDSEG